MQEITQRSQGMLMQQMQEITQRSQGMLMQQMQEMHERSMQQMQEWTNRQLAEMFQAIQGQRGNDNQVLTQLTQQVNALTIRIDETPQLNSPHRNNIGLGINNRDQGFSRYNRLSNFGSNINSQAAANQEIETHSDEENNLDRPEREPQRIFNLMVRHNHVKQMCQQMANSGSADYAAHVEVDESQLEVTFDFPGLMRNMPQMN